MASSATTRVAEWRVEDRPHDEAEDSIEQLLEDTHDPDPKVRKWAVHRLCPCDVKRNIPPVWDRLIAMVDDQDAGVRSQIFHTLCDGSPREREAQVVESLQRLHDDPDAVLRRRARKLLAHYRRTGRLNIL